MTTKLRSMALGMACAAAVLAPVTGMAEREAGPVKVTVTYKGKGTVDANHRLWVWIFDTPDINSGAIPIGERSLEKNGDVAAFEALAPEKVWIAVAYDEQGGFQGSAPPPTGAPVAFYSEEGGPPTAVTPGAAAAVTVVFDESVRMP